MTGQGRKRQHRGRKLISFGKVSYLIAAFASDNMKGEKFDSPSSKSQMCYWRLDLNLMVDSDDDSTKAITNRGIKYVVTVILFVSNNKIFPVCVQLERQ